MNYLLGADAGTTSMKCMLINEEGKEICLVNEYYDISFKKNSVLNNIIKNNINDEMDYANKIAMDFGIENSYISIVEFDAEGYWTTFKKAVQKVINLSKIDPSHIRALAISSQGETLICLDKNGKPLHNAIVWLDNRSTYEALEIKNKFGEEQVYNKTGQPEITTTWPATKILWLRNNEKEVFNQTYKFLLVGDYLNYKLTGKYCTDPSLSSSTLYLDIYEIKWWQDMLDFIGISESQLADIRNSGETIGDITEQACFETGLNHNTAVISGALDQMAGLVGAGNIVSNIITETTGTCLAMCVNITNHIPYSVEYNIPCHLSALPRKYSLLFWSQAAGAILEWFKNNFYGKERITYNDIDCEASKINPGSDGLILLPYFSGSAFPLFNPYAKGVLFGLTLNHTRAHIARTIMESVGFILKEYIEIAEKIGVAHISEIRSLGGGSKSVLWNQIKADITGKEIVTLENPETSVLGAAILAGIGVGVFKNLQEASLKCVKMKERYYPNRLNYTVYENAYNKYKDLMNSIEHLFNVDV